MIKYMNGYVFSKARYINGVGFEVLARTPVPKLLLSYPPPLSPEPFLSRSWKGHGVCVNYGMRMGCYRWGRVGGSAVGLQ